MRILVIGGTRFVGPLLVRDLAARGHAVTVWTRGTQLSRLPPEVETVIGDRHSRDVARQAFARDRYDVVVDHIAYTAEDVLDVARWGAGRFSHYVLTSTAWVYAAAAPQGSRAFVEEDVRIPTRIREEDIAASRLAGLPVQTREYLTGKLAAERATAQMEVPVTIVRPGMVAGPHDQNNRVGFYVQRLLDGGLVLLIGGGCRSVQLVFAEDLAGILAALIHAGLDRSGVYNIVPPASVTVQELVTWLADALHVEPVAVPLAEDEIRRRLPAYLQREPFALQVAGPCDSSRLFQACPDIRFTAYKAWLTATAQWYRQHQPAVSDTQLRLREHELAAALNPSRADGSR